MEASFLQLGAAVKVAIANLASKGADAPVKLSVNQPQTASQACEKPLHLARKDCSFNMLRPSLLYDLYLLNVFSDKQVTPKHS